MYQLVYISTATSGLDAAALHEVLGKSRSNNRRDGITGLLLFDGHRCLQVLEGAQPLVDAAFARIKADPRHRAVVMLHARMVAERSFAAWDMACEMIGVVEHGATLGETVDRLVAASSDRNLKALFSSFARIQRAA